MCEALWIVQGMHYTQRSCILEEIGSNNSWLVLDSCKLDNNLNEVIKLNMVVNNKHDACTMDWQGQTTFTRK